jgi:hypothetical protein
MRLHPVFESSATVSIDIDTALFPNCYSFFTNIYDNQAKSYGITPYNKKNIKFNIVSHLFRADGCIIKSLDIDFNYENLKLEIISDYIYNKDLQERRDEVIDEIFKEDKQQKEY